MTFAIWTSGYRFSSQLVEELFKRNLELKYIYISENKYLDIVNKVLEKYTIKILSNINSKDLLNKYKVDVILLTNYPKLITKELLDRQLFLNGHNSLLPKYRGMHAFSWALINDEKEVGYSLIKVDEGIDSGDILSQVVIPVGKNDDINTLFKKGKKLVDYWLAESLKHFQEGKLGFRKQEQSQATYVCRRKPEDNLIDWFNSAKDIHNFIRALAPPYTPGAFTFFKNKKINICNSELFETPSYKAICGQVVANFKDKGVLVKCLDGVLLIKDIIVNDVKMNSSHFFKSVGARLK